MTINQCVRAINTARQTQSHVFLRTQGANAMMHIGAARRKRGVLEVQLRGIHIRTWVSVQPSDHIEEWEGSHCVAIYAWQGPGHDVDTTT